MKKLISLLLIAALAAFSLFACGTTVGTDVSGESSEAVSAETSADTSAEEVPTTEMKTISSDVLRDKIAGSWAAQMIGVTWGAPTEFLYCGKTVPEANVPEWKSEMINSAFSQDDLYVEIPFIEAMKDNGSDCGITVIAEYFKNTLFDLDHANLQGRENLKRGIPAPDSGSYLYNYHADDIDWQIEADFLGNFYPGLVNEAAKRAFDIGHITNYGDGVYGGVYVAALHSAAFFAESIEEVTEAARLVIPEGTKFRSVIDEVTECYEKGMTWEDCWKQIDGNWRKTAKCIRYKDGDADIDAKLNAAFVLIGLLWGDGDMAKTIEISMRCGQDSDCNPSSAAAILGTLYGYDALDDIYVRSLDRNTAKFSYTDFTFDDCVNVSFDLMKETLAIYGAEEKEGIFEIPVDISYTPVTFEQWGDDEIVAYFTAEAVSDGKINIASDVSVPVGGDAGKIKHTLDMGDGTVLPFFTGSYQYTQNGKYTITYTVSLGGKTSSATYDVEITDIENPVDPDDESRTLEQNSILIVSVGEPMGAGCHDSEIIRDGYVPKTNEFYGKVQYDTFCYNYTDHEEYFGYIFRGEKTVSSVAFTEGAHFDNGGWFKNGSLRLEILIDGEWVKADCTVSPDYPDSDSQSAFGAAYETYTFTLGTPTACYGVRVIGSAGGSVHFTSIAELDVE